jgi:spore coat protein A, manganese oxidase
MLNRRRFIYAGGLLGAGLLVPRLQVSRPAAAGLAAVPGGTLDPTSIPKYAAPLFILAAMPPAGSGDGIDRFSVAVRQFRQQVLPPGGPLTTVWGYGSTTDQSSFHYPAPTIEATVNRRTRVRWANQLTDGNGNFLPHLFTVDPTLHWANPPGGNSGRDSRPTFRSTPPPYRGPVPLVTHLHGAHSREENDGYPEAWYLPAAGNLPSGFARVGTFYDRFKSESQDATGSTWDPGTAVFQYANDQRATALWFHDHVLGMTRANIYAGTTGFYLLRGGSSDLPAGVLPGPAPKPGDPAGTAYREIPLVIQDRSFNRDGSLYFPTSRDFFGDATPGGPFIPTTDLPPYWNPEFFGNTMVVNGRTWPALNVEARRYRFRLLNASNSRMVMLKIVTSPTATRPVRAALPIWQLGSDGGFLPAPVMLSRLLLGNAERADVIVDFGGVPAGTALYLINEGPDEPFGGGEPGVDYEPADPNTTGQVMKFVVRAATATDTSTPPGQLRLPALPAPRQVTRTRRLSLNELTSARFADAPISGQLGLIDNMGMGVPKMWMDPVTEDPAVNSTELWEIRNFTEDAHPIHVHQTQFQIVNRQPVGGSPRPPEVNERGFKDTVIAYPDEITRIRSTFDIAGRYVWHCHIIDHEDNEMMRPMQIG